MKTHPYPGQRTAPLRQRHDRKRLSGFTLVELMVAVALGLVVLLGLSVLFARNSDNQQELERTVRQLENARYALDTLGEDVMHAGFFSDFDPQSLGTTPAYQTPDPCATATNALGWNTGVSPMHVPTPIQGIAAGTSVTCLADRLGGTEALVVRRSETTEPIAMAAAVQGNLYVQVARCTTSVQRVLVAAAPSANPGTVFTMQKPDCATLNDSLRRVSQRTYYVASCNDCAPSDGIPTLKRVEMINGTLHTTAIAEGVENLQVEYGLDTDADGVPNSFGTMGSGVITGAGANVWQNVVSVRLHVLTRNTQARGNYSDTRTYQVGPDVVLDKPSDGFKRTLMTSTVRLQNVGGRRE